MAAKMLREIATKQTANDYYRRWFNDALFDLFLWYDDHRRAVGFQLCYDKDRRECALTYLDGRGYSHDAVDSGENSPWSNGTPVLREGGGFPRERVLGDFAARSLEIEPEVRRYVMQKLESYLQPPDATQPSRCWACGNGAPF